jgi:hypothetical protein
VRLAPEALVPQGFRVNASAGFVASGHLLDSRSQQYLARTRGSLQTLAAEGLPVLEFPQSPQRMTPATTGLYEAVVNGAVTHSGDPRLARHIGNATVRTDNRGTRIYKEHKHSTRRIDLAVCAIMAHSVAATVDPGLQLYWYEDAS